MTNIATQLGALLNLHSPPSIPAVTPVTTTAPTTTVSASGFLTTPTTTTPSSVTYGLLGLPRAVMTSVPTPTSLLGTPISVTTGYTSAGGLTWSSPPPHLPTGRPVMTTTPSMGLYTYPTHAGPAGPPPIPVSSAPASYLSSPLTAALQHIVDSDIGQPGMNLRPEYHVLHKQEGEPLKQITYKSMSYRKLVHGMVLVARNIIAQGGSVDTYLRHMEYVTRHGKYGDYTDQAYVEYDKIIIDNYVQNPSSGIKVGDTMAASYCFHDVTRIKPSSPINTILNNLSRFRTVLEEMYFSLTCN